MSRTLLPHIADHDFDIATAELIDYINAQFILYESASENGSEWQQTVAHSRLDGVLAVLDMTCALSTENIRAFMVSCTKASYLPFGYTRWST